MDGFISVERFQSLTEPDKLLSLSFWRDEEAVAAGGLAPVTARRSRPAAKAYSATIVCASLLFSVIMACPSAASRTGRQSRHL
jgi:hypothetical protein